MEKAKITAFALFVIGLTFGPLIFSLFNGSTVPMGEMVPRDYEAPPGVLEDPNYGTDEIISEDNVVFKAHKSVELDYEPSFQYEIFDTLGYYEKQLYITSEFPFPGYYPRDGYIFFPFPKIPEIDISTGSIVIDSIDVKIYYKQAELGWCQNAKVRYYVRIGPGSSDYKGICTTEGPDEYSASWTSQEIETDYRSLPPETFDLLHLYDWLKIRMDNIGPDGPMTSLVWMRLSDIKFHFIVKFHIEGLSSNFFMYCLDDENYRGMPYYQGEIDIPHLNGESFTGIDYSLVDIKFYNPDDPGHINPINYKLADNSFFEARENYINISYPIEYPKSNPSDITFSGPYFNYLFDNNPNTPPSSTIVNDFYRHKNIKFLFDNDRSFEERLSGSVNAGDYYPAGSFSAWLYITKIHSDYTQSGDFGSDNKIYDYEGTHYNEQEVEIVIKSASGGGKLVPLRILENKLFYKDSITSNWYSLLDYETSKQFVFEPFNFYYLKVEWDIIDTIPCYWVTLNDQTTWPNTIPVYGSGDWNGCGEMYFETEPANLAQFGLISDGITFEQVIDYQPENQYPDDSFVLSFYQIPNYIAPETLIKTEFASDGSSPYYNEYSDILDEESNYLGFVNEKGLYINTTAFMPEEELMIFGSSELAQDIVDPILSRLDEWESSNIFEAKTVLSLNDWYYDEGVDQLIYNEEDLSFDDRYDTPGFEGYDDSFYLEEDIFSEAYNIFSRYYYPLLAYDSGGYSEDYPNVGDPYIPGVIGYGYNNKDPFKVYHYDLYSIRDYVADDIETTFTSLPADPSLNINRVLGAGVIKALGDDPTSYEIQVNKRLYKDAIIDVGITSIEFPESIYSFEKLTSGAESSVVLHFNGTLDDVVMNMEIYPKLVNKSRNHFELWSYDRDPLQLTPEIGGYMDTFYFYQHDLNNLLRLPRRDLILEVELTFYSDHANNPFSEPIKFTCGPLLYVGNPNSFTDIGVDYTLLEYQEANITEISEIELIFNMPSEAGDYYMIQILQDENVITTKKSSNCFDEISTDRQVSIEWAQGQSSVIDDGSQMFDFDFTIISALEAIDGIYWEIYESSEKRLDGVLTTGQPAKSDWIISIDPKDLRNADPNRHKLIVYFNVGNNLEKEYFYFTVDYFLNDEYYTIDSKEDLNYVDHDIITNSKTHGSIVINYGEEKGYNYEYIFPSDIDDLIYSTPQFYINYMDRHYTPISGTYSNFEFQDKPVDLHTLHFNVKTPTLTESGEDWLEFDNLPNGQQIIKINIILSSELDFKNVLCKFEPFFGVKDSLKYNYTLLILEGDRYIESDIDLTFEGGFLEESWTFTIENLEEGEYYYQIYGIFIGQQEIDLASILYGVIGGVVGFFVIILIGQFTFKKKIDNKILYYLIVAGVSVGIGIGVWAAMSFMGALAPTYGYYL